MVIAYMLTVSEASAKQIGVALSERVGPELEEAAVTAAEKLEQRGLIKGREQGLREGLLQGLLKGLRTLLLRQLAAKFGAVPQSVEERIEGANEDELGRWGELLVTAASLEEVFGE